MAKIPKKSIATDSEKFNLEEIKQRLVDLKTSYDIGEVVLKELKKYAKDHQFIEYDTETIVLKMHANNHGYSLQFRKTNYLYNPFKEDYEAIHDDQNITLFTSIDAIVGKDYVLKDSKNKIALCISIQKGSARGSGIVVKNTATEGYEKRSALLNPSATDKLLSLVKNVASGELHLGANTADLKDMDIR